MPAPDPPLATSQAPSDYAVDRYPPNTVRLSAVVSLSGIATGLVAPAHMQYTYSCELGIALSLSKYRTVLHSIGSAS